jgi:hypothetical protein
MIDPRVLNHFKTTNEQLRRFFTAKPAGKDPKTEKETPEDPLFKQKDKFVKWVSGLIQDGRLQCFRDYRFYAAVDLMNDSQPIMKENIPLLAYAQGKIDVKSCVDQLHKLGCANKFLDVEMDGGGAEKARHGDDDKEVKGTPRVNMPRLYEVCINVGRSFISRRVNAQANKYNSLRPFFAYAPRGTSMVDHLRGEVMGQYAEVMSDSFGYRHQHTQCIRSMLNYRTVQFPAGAWECETQTEVAPDDFDGETLGEMESPDMPDTKLKLRTRITREGVKMITPNPARVIYDTSKPLSSLNTDTGCRWVGFFDVQRFGDIKKTPDFFNIDNITWTPGGLAVVDENRPFFDLIFAGQPINFPSPSKTTEQRSSTDVAGRNERTAQSFVYGQTDEEHSVFVTDLRVKICPKDWGMGDYPHKVWLRLVIAADNTVIFAEWMPSLPAVYWGHNEDDNRLLNLAQSHECMWAQDQLSNIFSQLLLKMKHSLLRVLLINTDIVSEADRKKFRAMLDSPKYYTNPHLLEVSFKELAGDLKLDLSNVFHICSPGDNDTEYINNAFRAIVQILSIMERLMNLSPQEQGQPMPRESSAEEIAALENSTQVTYNAIGSSIDEARAAWKKVVYESAMAFASDQIYLPVSQRFSKETIKKAGFEIDDEEAENDTSASQRGHTVIGSKRMLVTDYIWQSRDGGDRFTSKESANVLVQLLGQVLPLIGPEAFGKQRIFAIVNEIFRLLASYDLKLDLNEGESNSVMAPEAQKQFQTIAQQFQALQAAVTQEHQEVGGLTDAVEKLQEIVSHLSGGGAPAGPGPAAMPMVPAGAPPGGPMPGAAMMAA